MIDVVIHENLRPTPRTRGELMAAWRSVLEDSLGECITPRSVRGLEAELRAICKDYMRLTGDTVDLPVILQSHRDPVQLMLADEKTALGLIANSHWYDPERRKFQRSKPMLSDLQRDPPHPEFNHDCPSCTYLGTVCQRRPESEHRGIRALMLAVFDLYFCTQHGLPTVIARYGHAGPDYTSGMALAAVDPLLAEAKRRADERGLLETVPCTSNESEKDSFG